MMLPCLSLSRYLEFTFLALASTVLASLKFFDSDTHTLASSNLSDVYQLNPISDCGLPLILVIIRFGLLCFGMSATSGLLSNNLILLLLCCCDVALGSVFADAFAVDVSGLIIRLNNKTKLVAARNAVDWCFFCIIYILLQEIVLGLTSPF